MPLLLIVAGAAFVGARATAPPRDRGRPVGTTDIAPPDLGAPATDESPTLTAEEIRRILSLGPLPDAPPPDPTNRVADDPRAAALGHRLFFERALSQTGTVSCAFCHDPAIAFTDGVAVAAGIGGLDRHTPTVQNVAWHRWFFWDGRADTLWGQALDPLEDPLEHGFDRISVLRVVRDDPLLRRNYEEVFGPLPDLDRPGIPRAARPKRPKPAGDHRDPRVIAWNAMATEDRREISAAYANIGKALAAYQRRLRSGESPFDRFARALRDGDAAGLSALSPAARRGLALFIGDAGCRNCHSGVLLSDSEFHSTGVPPLGGGPLRDPGRFRGIERLRAGEFTASGPFSDDPDGPRAALSRGVVHDPSLWGAFRTPSLRGVADTAPYMHEGQFETLREVLRHYNTLEGAVLPSHHQETVLRPLDLPDDRLEDLIAFLESLTGEPPPAAWREAPDPE